MSIQSIQVYRSKVEKIIQYGGSHNESALWNANGMRSAKNAKGTRASQ